ncbi:MAG: LysR family transcriptional regulator [Sphingomonas sp.]|uniref:LysR family transcriptional regulator n=1 Tax=Sphingomonas sp. TaxID=28214 RepID=UPI001B00DABE|nr:LysR family transcriptional regulator [Sphingomonas sp.]MBO9621554.1 LysR family transcriptional regulator [Sphingomonas sp.]
MRTFVRVAERGSLSAVARELGVGQSTITRQLRELEDALGVSLLSRTTRRVTITPEGSQFYARSLQVLQLVDMAGEELANSSGSAFGTVRLSCSAAIGVLHFSRLLFEFQDLHPNVGIDLSLTDERVDLVREGVDLAIRLGPFADSSMRLRSLGQSRRVLVASPAYLNARGRPAVPDDLATHECIRMSNVSGSDTLVLRDPEGGLHRVAIKARLNVDHGLAAREALLAGRGYAPAHRWLVEDAILSGALEAILPAYAPPSTPLSLLIVPERARIHRVRLLIDFLSGRIGSIAGIDR